MRVVKEFKGSEGKIEGGERNSRVLKAKSKVMKEFKGGEGKIEDDDIIQGW